MTKASLRFFLSGLLACVVLSGDRAHAAATIKIVNGNAAACAGSSPVCTGFNDPAPATPVGGNRGTTVGEQRLVAFTRAAEIWGEALDSDVNIIIRGTFEPLTCAATSGTLGSAGPRSLYSNFDNAGFVDTWYHVALANKLAKTDLTVTSSRPEGQEQITARFNSKLGSTGCLEASGWYYGLDANHGNKINLISVLLHEFGHGLGFSTSVDKESGELFNRKPDIFSRFIYDNVINLHWDQMSNQQRATSAVNSSHVVWDGSNVRRDAPKFLGPRTVLNVTSPSTISGIYEIGLAGFGPKFTQTGVSGTVVQAKDPADPVDPPSGTPTGPPAVASTTDGCSALSNASEVNGKIALIDRGGCTFVIKVKNAQNAGARAVIIVENNPDLKRPDDLGGSDPTITIPAVRVITADGDKFKVQLATGVSVVIRLDPQALAGADTEGRIRLYAPDPVIGGSSISHWDSVASPNLLMEPNISSDLSLGLDLTLALFADIGWFTNAVAKSPSVSASKSASLLTDRDGDGLADPGDTIRYTVVLRNSGEGAATVVRLTDTIDPNTTIVPGSLTATAGTVTGSSPVDVAIGDLAPAAEVTVRFDVFVNNSTASSVAQVSNQATVTGTNFDPVNTDDPSTSTAADTTRISTNFQSVTAEMTVAVAVDSDGNRVVSRGDTVRYTVTIRNLGVSAINGVTYSSSAGSNLSLVPGSATTTSGTVTQLSSNAIAVAVGTVNAGQSVTITYQAVVSSSTPLTTFSVSNQGSVSGSNFTTVLTDDPATSTRGDATTSVFSVSRRRSTRR
ncbi:MAG TPA: PA domain-containing protein [Thermoanaerobaculia bacterium]|nr:PA domain-containing protein [Thermoanaerobaculia bacterium]